MKSSRRIARMERVRKRRAMPKLNLTSLMDVFTILVFFLLVNSATTEVLQQPKQIALPDSVVETKPRETVIIFVSPQDVLVQGVRVASVADIEAMEGERIGPVGARLAELSENVIGFSTRAVAESRAVTVLADRTVPFDVVRKIMATCTGEGYTKVSLAVIQKATQST